MQRHPLLILALTATPLLASPPTTSPTIHPEPRTDPNSQLAHQQLLQKTRQGRIDVYFLGDSITRRWGASDPQYAPLLDNWRKHFHGYNAANFGWGGDTTRNILWRITNGQLDHIQPKVIVLLAGTNDLPLPHPSTDAKIADVTAGIRAILSTCQAKVPQATILLTAILPRTDKPELMPVIHRINQHLASLADDNRVRFVNLTPQLLTPAGQLREGFFDPDQLHPAVPTYDLWAESLKPHLHELLGPPSPTDQAPPPTGDPSATSKP